jgi:hypothetical protein
MAVLLNCFIVAAIPYMEKMAHFFVILSAAKESECAKMLEKSCF